jgi:hypothetical protein
VNVERSDDGVRPTYARDAVATARLSQGSVNNLIVVPFGDVWMPTRTVQAFLRWEQGGATQGLPSTGLIDIQLVLRSNPTPKVTPRSFKELALWLRGDHGIVAQGDRLSTWADQSGFQRDATQATAANQPLYVDSALNGVPGIYFDGTRIMSTPAFSISTYTVFAVYRNTTAGLKYEQSVDANVNDGSWLYGTTFSAIHARRGAINSAKDLGVNWDVDNVNRIVRVENFGTSASHNMYINGTLQSMTVNQAGDIGTGPSTSQPIFIGGRSGVVAPMTGHLMELVIFSPALTAAAASALERTYFGPRYGLTVA